MGKTNKRPRAQPSNETKSVQLQQKHRQEQEQRNDLILQLQVKQRAANGWYWGGFSKGRGLRRVQEREPVDAHWSPLSQPNGAATAGQLGQKHKNQSRVASASSAQH